MKKTLFLLLLFAPCTWAQTTRTAATCSSSDVQATVNLSADGDTVVVPSVGGPCTWSTGITVPSGRGVTITGTGTPSADPTVFGTSASCSATVINLATGVTGITMTPTFGNATSRISCMKLQPTGSSAIGFVVNGTCTAGGCPNVRIDNLTFPSGWSSVTNPNNSFGWTAIGGMFGVIDHNTVTGTANSGKQFTEFSHDSYLGVGAFGDNSWHLSENYGSANFLFMENNNFSAIGTTENETNLVPRGGGRIVIRYNQFNVMDNFDQMMSWHGTESNGRFRGVRTFELYRNTYSCPGNCDTTAAGRSGTGMIWGNVLTYGGVNTDFKFSTYRTQGNTGGWGACDGSSVVDTNDGVTYFSGTVASFSGGVVTVSGTPGWTTNQWTQAGAPYSMHDITKNSGTFITASGTNTLTLSIGGGPGAFTGPSPGDSIQILRASACLDQGYGRGAGVLYSGSGIPTTTSAEVLSPTYVFFNSFNKPPVFDPVDGVASNNTLMTRNREYYSENLNQLIQSSTSSPFNGTTTIGMGHGTLANRPATCTVGVAYWATDQGTWNHATGGKQGQLSTCTSTNVWTTFYTPFTYPHPLITGGTVVSPNLVTSPALINFGNQNVSTTSAQQTVTTTNSGTSNGILASPHYSFSPNFATDYPRVGGSCLDGQTIPPGGSCTDIYVFSPTTVGSRNTTLTIVGGSGTNSPTVVFTGTGVSPTIPLVTLGPRNVNFGNVNVGSLSSPTTFTLTNSGTASLSITSISVRFPINSNLFGLSLAPGISCTFQALFSPIAAVTLNAQISVVTNAGSTPDIITLSGTGVAVPTSPLSAPSVTVFVQGK
jgi:hypothetical protein